MTYVDWLSGFTSYRPAFDYWEHFSFVEGGGPARIRGLFSAFFEDSKCDYKRLTELVITMNHKIWQHSQNPLNKSICDEYSRLWLKAKKYAEESLKGEPLAYYLKAVD